MVVAGRVAIKRLWWPGVSRSATLVMHCPFHSTVMVPSLFSCARFVPPHALGLGIGAHEKGAPVLSAGSSGFDARQRRRRRERPSVGGHHTKRARVGPGVAAGLETAVAARHPGRVIAQVVAPRHRGRVVTEVAEKDGQCLA